MSVTYCEVHFFRPLMSSYLSQSSQGTILESKIAVSQRVCQHKQAAPDQESKQWIVVIVFIED